MKKLHGVCLGVACMLLLLCGLKAEAAGYQLNISLGKTGGSVGLSLYRIADAQERGYQWLTDYEGMDLELSGLKKAKETQNAAKEIAAWIQEKKLPAAQSSQTDAGGRAAFSAEAGAYLLVKDTAEGEMSPVLILIPKDHEGESFEISPKYSKAAEKTEEPKAQTGNGAGTGDAANPILWIAAMAVTVLGVLLIVIYRRRKK